MKKLITIMLLIAMVSVALAGCAPAAPAASTAPAAPAQSAAPAAPAAPAQSAAPAAAVDSIKIGALYSLTGGTATRGNHYLDATYVAQKEINDAGGIKSLGGAQIDIIAADTESDPTKAVSSAERLITADNVSAILGCYSSGPTLAVAEVTDRYKVPLMVNGAVTSKLCTSGYQYVFRMNQSAIFDGNDSVDSMIDMIAKQNLEPLKTIGVLYELSDWGQGTAEVIKARAIEKGLEVVVDDGMQAGISDFTPQIMKLKETMPDIVFTLYYTDDQLLFIKTYNSNNVNLKYGYMCGSAEDPVLFEAMTPAEYDLLLNQDDMDMNVINRLPKAKALADDYEARTGWGPNPFWFQGYTATYVLYYAIEAAASTEPQAIRDALSALKLDSSYLPTDIMSYDMVEFDETGQNPNAHSVVIQWIDGAPRNIWPDANVYEEISPKLYRW